ncbi:MAG: GNAT family N-acetyltransferase [Chloroflexota bacterium]
MVAFLPADDCDFGELVRTSKIAFDDDVNYGAPSPGGPFGYDSITWHRRAGVWGARLYKIVNDGAIVGGIVVQPDPHHNPRTWYLSRLWLLPEYQNKGIGTQAEAFAESVVPAARLWKLDTPLYNKRNQHFYEKLGYKRTGVKNGMVLYDKKIEQSD